ncbi:hypothetical protein [Geobacter sp. SVR]|uniref:hypothetical protein n=1 Tax=Geobacter sp. SVR TaxID=2495594 RepID=UPI00143EF805|nr:hypothetical protein [Geobacter sp. SVR]BCS54391.1 hypothetical protein GSVR_26990 [Geobacter sp. SVR]GCF87440.1 hypothetical protein GSbR_40400 [Geobacter sp. SVR]
MNGKYSLMTIAQSLMLVLMGTGAAHAASTNKVYMSGTLILLFLGFCALVVVIQLMPAIATLYGMIKGALSGSKQKAEATSRNR